MGLDGSVATLMPALRGVAWSVLAWAGAGVLAVVVIAVALGSGAGNPGVNSDACGVGGFVPASAAG